MSVARMDHLRRLTDPRGLIHAASDDCPDRSQGYDSIDNADALRLCAVASDTVHGETLQAMAGTYFGYLTRARCEDSRMHHACDAGGVWVDDGDDALVQSRLARALAAVVVSELPIRLRLAAAEWFSQLLPQTDHARTPVSAANWLIALGTLRCADPGRDLARAAALAKWLVEDCYYATRSGGWEWFSPEWSAGAACIPNGLWHACTMLDEPRLASIAQTTTSFVLDNLFEGDVLMPVGTRGGWHRHGSKALFDQMPAEVTSIVELCRTAEQITRNSGYHDFAIHGAAWFTGANMHGTSLVSPGGGCSSALRADGRDRNQDATAMVAFLLARASLSEPAPVEMAPTSHIMIG